MRSGKGRAPPVSTGSSHVAAADAGLSAAGTYGRVCLRLGWSLCPPGRSDAGDGLTLPCRGVVGVPPSMVLIWNIHSFPLSSHMAQFQYGILSPVISLLANEIWKPIKKHFGYCFRPESKVRNLARAADELKITIDTIDEKIQLGEREGKRPKMQATGWIESARSVEDESYIIKNEYEGRSIHIFGCSWNCFFNYKTGSAATKKKSDIDEIKERAPQNNNIFRLLPPAGRELPLPPNIVGQNEYKDKIVGYIKQGTTSFIGICGMGGAGKTTLLKQLNNIFSYAAEMHEFDHVIYVEVGQKQNLDTVQQTIASQLGLALGQDESTTSRSASLYNFLKKRKFLLLIDDLWQTLDLVKVGIPQGYIQNRQMIIITTRLQHVCYRMQAHGQVIMLQRLNFDEAWSLFGANAGDRPTNSSAQIRGYAESIVEKCGGLPLALKIVGQAMASKESEHEWKHAVMLLQQSQFHKVPDAECDLYSVLYISYDHLPDERTKQCFLLFVLTSYDHMKVTHTIDFWMGHGLLDEDNDIRNRYLRGHSIVGCLKRACLLEEHPQGESYLRMHDIIRDLALWIVSTQQGDGCNKKWLARHHGKPLEQEEWGTAERIFLWGKSDVTIPDSCSCPLLLTLVLQFNTRICKVPRGFFRTAPSLTYLDLSRTNIQELPSDVGALVNLQHLNLSETPIQSIQMELRLLKSLRYLYLAYTYHLKAIPDGTISALSMLKVLDLYDSGRFPKDKTQAYIDELERLTWLQFLGFTVGDRDSLHRILNLSKASLRFLYIKGVEHLQRLHISPILIGKTRAQQLERLALHGIESLEELLIGDTNVESNWHFQSLDDLRLWDLQKLGSIVWKGVFPYACLPRLRRLQIYGCHSIKTVTWIKQLPCLEEVYLVDCDSMLELVTDDDEGTMSSDTASFPRLKVLGLSELMNVQNICDSTLAFPCLQFLLVYKCPILAKLPSKLLKEDSQAAHR